MAKQIACGHCGGTHGSVAEVRACALAEDVGAAAAPPAAPPPPTASRQRPASTREPAPAATTHPSRTAVELAGPDALGRSLLLDADDAGPVPAPWADAPVVEADAGAHPDLVERLHRAWRRRERLVIRWAGPLPAEDPVLVLGGAAGMEFWHLGPGSELPGERLRFAVTTNAVDARGTAGPERSGSRFEPLGWAAALGARPAGDGADIGLGDGGPALVDGGPLAPLDAGFPVVPRHHLLAGRLRPQQPAPPPPTANLAADQLAAVAHRGGPARILAPAGSGKTRVLTERTRHLVADWGLHPAAVSLVAYNRRARAEMGQRLTDVPALEIRTINSLALALATGRRGGSSARRGLTTISELDARRLLERLVPGRRRRQLADPLEPWVDALSACRLGLRDPDEVEASYGADVTGFGEVLGRYRAELRRHDALDFDEQILAAIEVLLTDPAARAEARRTSPILLVDEFQDLTPAHLLLVRLLAGPAAEVYAVGDDDQTIYGYTGASPRWLVDFERWFPGAADHRLTVNYRCPPAVVAAASSLLSHNRYRVTKEIEPAPGRTPVPGELTVTDGSDPQATLVARVGELLAGGARPGDIAVLARVNAALLPAALHLAAAGHPVARPPGLDHRMLERSGMAAALAWLRLA
ncbi:MAG: ATP-dependent helicase, partial [Acidimicrobiia bacterium]|nr:ATP-dependent helicase [Acidimicrobiia bacterium]